MSRPLSALAAFAAATALLLPAATAQAGQVVVTEATTGDTVWIVPAGVTSVAIRAVGEHGQAGASGGGAGGRAGSAAGTLAVTPGAALTLSVDKGGAAGGGPVSFELGGAGGGFSGVLLGGVFQVVGAGGGGGGAGLGFGGGAGGDPGAAGANGDNGAGNQPGLGGGAGTSVAGGAGGANGAGGSRGADGATGAGGQGGTYLSTEPGGGGGGAGRFGGGGGGAAGVTVSAGAGGGGGSSYVAPGLTATATGVTDDTVPSVRLIYTDTTAPAATLAAPTATNPATLSGTAGTGTGDDRHVTIALFSGTGTTGSPAKTVDAAVAVDGSYGMATPALSDGTWTAVAAQSDDAGNTGTSTARTFAVDRTAPTVALAAFPKTINNARPTFTGTTTGGATSMTLLLDGHDAASSQTFAAPLAGDGSFSAAPPRDLPDGPYSISALASDAAGNGALSPAVAFTVDTAPPAQPPATRTVTTTVTGPTVTTTVTTTQPPPPPAKAKLKVSLSFRAASHHRATIAAKVTATEATAAKVKVCLSGPPIGRKSKCWSLTSLAAGKSKTYTFTTRRAGTVRATATAPGATSAAPVTKAIKIR